MNVEDTLKAMLEAGASAAKRRWKAMSEFATAEFRALATAAATLAENAVADLAAAAALSTAKKRATATAKAKLRATLNLENLQLATEGVLVAGKADVKLAAQDAINAAIGVLTTALNKSVGVDIF